MKELKQICQVLLCLSENDDWLTIVDISQLIDLSQQQLEQALKQLVIKQKIQKRKKKGQKNEYKYIDELVKPSNRPAYVKCKSPVSKAMEARIPLHTANCFRFAQKKIALLEKLKNKVTPDEKDLIIGMINDYSGHQRIN